MKIDTRNEIDKLKSRVEELETEIAGLKKELEFERFLRKTTIHPLVVESLQATLLEDALLGKPLSTAFDDPPPFFNADAD